MDDKKITITPAELKNRRFDRKVRGYDPEQVDETIQLAAESLEQSLLKIDSLAADMKRLRERVADFERMESTIKNTLVSAQGSVDELRKNALKEAELMKREAEIEAVEKAKMHQREAEQVRVDIEKLKAARSDYLVKLRVLVSGHQEMLAKLSDEFDNRNLDEEVIPSEQTN
jgi:cell division initiation protein